MSVNCEAGYNRWLCLSANCEAGYNRWLCLSVNCEAGYNRWLCLSVNCEAGYIDGFVWVLIVRQVIINGFVRISKKYIYFNNGVILQVKWSEVVAVGQNLLSISSQAGLQLLNVLVTLTLSHRSFNYDTDHGCHIWSFNSFQ